MKKIQKILFICLCASLQACATNPYMSSEDQIATSSLTQGDIETAMNEIVPKLLSTKSLARHIAKNKDKQTKLYRAGVENKTNERLDSIITVIDGILESAILDDEEGRFILIDVNNASINEELVRQRGGSVDENDIVEAAKSSGADTLITGALSSKGQNVGGNNYQEYTILFRVTDVKTRRLLASARSKAIRKQQKKAKLSW